jgi:aspartate-semialdehyde dehydrogenase
MAAAHARVAVVGATGAVGEQLLELIASRHLAPMQLRVFASEVGASRTVDVGGQEHAVERLESPAQLADFDLAFLAVPERVAAAIIDAKPLALLIDLSAAARPAAANAPLVAPGHTPRERFAALRERGVIAVAHPAAHAIAACIRALDVAGDFAAATLLQGASAGGRERVAGAVAQSTDLLSGRLALEDDEVQRGFNLLVDDEERAAAGAIASQVGVLLSRAPRLVLRVVAAPVLHGAGLALQIAAPAAAARAEQALRAAPGLLLVERDEPLGIIDAVGQDAILVRADQTPSGPSLWCVFDNSRLAALTAVWAAENLL